MSWGDDYKSKLVTAEEAVSCIQSGDRVYLSGNAGVVNFFQAPKGLIKIFSRLAGLTECLMNLGLPHQHRRDFLGHTGQMGMPDRDTQDLTIVFNRFAPGILAPGPLGRPFEILQSHQRLTGAQGVIGNDWIMWLTLFAIKREDGFHNPPVQPAPVLEAQRVIHRLAGRGVMEGVRVSVLTILMQEAHPLQSCQPLLKSAPRRFHQLQKP